MTREEIIKGYTNNQKKSTWIQLGSNVITSNTKLYNKGMVYQVKVDNAPLFDCLVFCREDHIGGLDWTQGNIIDSFSGEISFGNNIIDPNLIVVMSKADFDEADASAVPSDFVPFQETLKEETGDIIISDSLYHQIISCLGYPYVTEEELEYSREDICNIPLRMALAVYYRYFPRAVVYTYPVTGGVQEVEYPYNCYDVISYQVNQGTGSLDGQSTGEISNTLLRYIDLQMSGIGVGGASSYGGLSSLTGNYYGMYSPKTQTSNVSSMTLGRAAVQAQMNYLHRYRIDKVLKTDDNGNSKYYARFYSNKIGATIEMTFAQKDYNYNHVDYARLTELIKLAQAYVKKFFADLRSQAKPISGNITDYKEWKQEADNAIKEVNGLWSSLIRYRGIQRGSL